MLNSVNTNVGAMIALQNLNSTYAEMQKVQTHIDTGLKVSTAKDDGATWAIAQNQRSVIGALESVKDSLNRGVSITDVALTGTETISDLLIQMKAKAVSAADTTLDTTSRSALNEDFKALRDQITKVVQSADFNGANLLKTGAAAVMAIASAAADKLTVNAEVMALGAAGSAITLAVGASFNSAATASALISTLSTSITNVSAAAARLGTGVKKLQMQNTFMMKLSDAMTAGVGNLVDADLAKDSAKLQALQTKQQLGAQALSIANQAPTSLLSLFK